MKKIISIILCFIVGCMMTLTASAFETPYNDNADFLWGVNVHSPATAVSYKLVSLEDQVHYAAQLGVKIIRIDITKNMDVSYLDTFVGLCNQYGIKVMFALTSCIEVDEPENAEMIVNGYAERYNGKNGKFKVDYFQFKNEVDLTLMNESGIHDSGETVSSYPEESLKKYLTLFKAMQNGLDKADTTAESVINISWLHYGYLKYLSDNGLKWDIVGLDWYSDMKNQDLKTYLSQLLTLFPEQKLIICESNVQLTENDDYNDINNWNVLLDFIKDSYDFSKSNPRFIGFIVYELLDSPNNLVNKYESNFGLIKADVSQNNTYIDIENKAIYSKIQQIFGGKQISKISSDFLDLSVYDEFSGTANFEDSSSSSSSENGFTDKTIESSDKDNGYINGEEIPVEVKTNKQIVTKTIFDIPWLFLILTSVGMIVIAVGVVLFFVMRTKKKFK